MPALSTADLSLPYRYTYMQYFFWIRSYCWLGNWDKSKENSDASWVLYWTRGQRAWSTQEDQLRLPNIIDPHPEDSRNYDYKYLNQAYSCHKVEVSLQPVRDYLKGSAAFLFFCLFHNIWEKMTANLFYEAIRSHRFGFTEQFCNEWLGNNFNSCRIMFGMWSHELGVAGTSAPTG